MQNPLEALDLSRKSPFYQDHHAAWRDTLRRWVTKEIMPFVDDWDEASEFPRELYRKASEIGLLGLGWPEAFGGSPSDPFMSIITSQELARHGAGGINAGLMSHGIGLPPIRALGSEAMQARVIPPVLAGDKISALAITEPSCGSDVAALTTSARREGDVYVVNGGKTYITSGMRADFYTVAVRTGGEGAGGISLLLIERDREGFSRTPLKKQGWWASDTASLYFDDVRVPVENLIGAENQGFAGIMRNFNGERIGMTAGALGFSRVCLEDAIVWARERRTFGKRLADHQVIRHKLADMYKRISVTQAWLETLAWRIQQGEQPIAEIALLKVQATETLEYCARESMQVMGGAGYMRGSRIERIYREVRVNAIGGGSEEIMRDLAARQMGI